MILIARRILLVRQTLNQLKTFVIYLWMILLPSMMMAQAKQLHYRCVVQLKTFGERIVGEIYEAKDSSLLVLTDDFDRPSDSVGAANIKSIENICYLFMDDTSAFNDDGTGKAIALPLCSAIKNFWRKNSRGNLRSKRFKSPCSY